MKLKNFLIEFGYWLGMILGLFFLARSCAELSYAQQRFSAPNYHVRPATPESGYVIYERICRNCLRSEIEREQWFQHYVEPPKSEFQKLKEKQRAKQ